MRRPLGLAGLAELVGGGSAVPCVVLFHDLRSSLTSWLFRLPNSDLSLYLSKDLVPDQKTGSSALLTDLQLYLSKDYIYSGLDLEVSFPKSQNFKSYYLNLYL